MLVLTSYCVEWLRVYRSYGSWDFASVGKESIAPIQSAVNPKA